MNSLPVTGSRQLIVDILWRWEKENSFADDLLTAGLLKSSFSVRDRALVTASVNGVIRWKKSLDWLIDFFSLARKPGGKSFVRQILRLSIFHLLYLEKIPPHAVLHQAGELARASLSPPEAAYVNALLRKLQSRRGKLPFPPPDEKIQYLSVVYSHPHWMIARWLGRWDFDKVEELSRINNAPPPIFIRVNRLKVGAEELVKKLKVAGAEVEYFESRTGVLKIKPGRIISTLAPFREGGFQVQDVSSLAVVDLLDPRPGETVADFCAAPGGKASCIAEKMRNRGLLLAADADGERLNLLRENFSRLGITNARVEKIDLLKEENQLTNFWADRILLDVPCSNTGVLRRRVDARWRIRKKDITRLGEQGLELLRRGARYLRPGGRIVYSTCSLETEENERVVERFLAVHPEYTLMEEKFNFPEEKGGDGFYAAVLKRREKKE